MAKYVVTYEFSPENQQEAIDRFLEGSALETPEGVTVESRWHAVSSGRGWVVLEADHPSSILDNLLPWTDIITYEVTPVVDDETLGQHLVKHGQG